MLRTVTEASLSQDPDSIRQELLREMLNNERMVGIWADTIVPRAKDFLRWGSNVINKSRIPELLTSSAGDIAIAGLATIQPEIALALKGL